MTFVHGKNTVVKLNAVNLSAYSNSTEYEKNSDKHDVTCYGKSSHVFSGGLKGGTCTIAGIYDTTAVSGPRAAINPLIGTVVTLLHQSEGTGTGKPQDSVSVVVEKYTESAPVADMIKWSVDLQFSDDVDSTAQS